MRVRGNRLTAQRAGGTTGAHNQADGHADQRRQHGVHRSRQQTALTTYPPGADPVTVAIRRAVVEVVRELIVKPTKTHAVRTVGLDSDTAALLRVQWTTAVEIGLTGGVPPKPEHFVFQRQPSSTEPMPPDRISQAWRRLCQDAGVKARLHDLRHLQASLRLDAGEAVAVVAARLGPPRHLNDPEGLRPPHARRGHARCGDHRFSPNAVGALSRSAALMPPLASGAQRRRERAPCSTRELSELAAHRHVQFPV